MKKKKKNNLVLVVLLIVALIALAGVVLFGSVVISYYNAKVTAMQQQKDALYGKINDYETGQLKPVINRPPTTNKINLVKQLADGTSETLLSLDAWKTDIVGDGDWIYYGDTIDNTSESKNTVPALPVIWAYNVVTGEKKLLYSEKPEQSIVDGGTMERYVGVLEKIGDTLYSNVGGEFGGCEFYSYNLKTNKLSMVLNGCINQYEHTLDEQDVFSSVNGDGPCGIEKKYLLDQVNNKLVKVFDGGGCFGLGDTPIGYYNNKLYAYTTVNEEANLEVSEDFDTSKTHISEIYSIDLNTFTRNIVLKKSLPANAKYADLDVNRGMLLLSTDKEIYTFKLENSDLKKFADVPVIKDGDMPLEGYFGFEWTPDTGWCFNTFYTVNLDNNSLDETNCWATNQEVVVKGVRDLPEVFSVINLPEGYKFSY